VNNRKTLPTQKVILSWLGIPPTSRSPVHASVVSVRLYLHLPHERALRLDRFTLFLTLCLSAGRCDLHECAAEFIPTSIDKNSSGDEIANVNFLRQHRTCTGQRLRPFNEFVISTKRLRQKRYTLPTCLEMDSPLQSASHNKWTRPSVKESHQATWA